MLRTPQWPGLGRLLTATLLLTGGPLAVAYNLDPNSTESVTAIAKQMAEDMLSFYHGDQPGGTPGLLPNPYYWWEAGAMMGSLVDYWYYTKDDSYNNLTTQGLLYQVGDTIDYMPRNQTLTEGNDDQGFWALAVMSAAESRFPNPPADKPQWLALAQAVFNTQAARWDPEHCGGGLRWQIFKWNNGFDYKNSISQGCFFALGARLALYTGNNSYADWAEKTWDWMVGVDFIDENWRVLDGAHIGHNCTDITPYQFTYNAGTFILGAAAMYNHTKDQRWKDRLDKLLDATKVFFTGPDKNIMTEVACEPVDRCNLDQQSFKAYLSRWLAAITKWAPHTYDYVMPYLRASAVAAAKQCVGGQNGRMCGLKWNQDKYDASTGVGQQMAAMEVTLSCIVKDRAAPATQNTGGTSKGSPGAGGDDIGRDQPNGPSYKDITAGDKAGAAILTLLVTCSMIAGIVWIFIDEASDKTPMQQFSGFHSSATASIAAFAAGGGAAAVLLLKKGAQEFNEKTAAAVSPVSERSSRSSADNNRAIEEAPFTICHVRNQNVGNHEQRLSNMPLGWPHNRSLRGSTVMEPGQGWARSTRDLDGARQSDNEAGHSMPSASSKSMPGRRESAE
ncbi:Mannan endo-1,6-alpha-mannosidase DCW1 [Tolypocladium capitatum]|uniref:mannan endo-1,6-alpha-mannosidase n=1 Tax=Tolypocladium capitatum TaxID=45235 RepID=A0A2K3QR71_9HYPO|nr:Mannan endo-1,6-alpha-mannosidase DCW1 [Tolypocladium capitatum]